MYLFNYAREGEKYIDKPHVSIKIGSGCPAGCDCDFSYKKIKNITLYSKESIVKNIDYILKNFSLDFEIFFVGINLLKYDNLFFILDYVVSNGRKFKLQIPHNLDTQDYRTLSNLYDRYGAFDCSVPKTIDNYMDLSNIIMMLNEFKKYNILGKIYFDIFIDINRYENIIKKIITKLSTTESNNSYNCIIGKTFDLKFHDLSWKINNLNKEISDLKRKKCLIKDYYYLKDDKVFLYDHIEIGPGGGFTFHDNLCYLGNFEISNTLFDQNKIYNHFVKYSDYIKNISDGNLVIQCYKCIKNKYSYKKLNEEYVY